MNLVIVLSSRLFNSSSLNIGILERAHWICCLGPTIGNVSLLGNLMFESVTVRRWKVTDNKGNTNNNCLQLFPNIRPDSLFMPDSNYIEVNCGDKISPKELYELRNPDGKRKYSKSTLAPWFKIQLAGQTDSVHYVLPNHPNSCSYVTAYTDQVIETIGNTKKVLRTWSWVDWCRNRFQEQVYLLRLFKY